MALSTRVDTTSLTVFDTHFERVQGTASAGRWGEDTGGSTGSSGTGPGTNNPSNYAFVHTEASGGSSLGQLETNGIAVFKSVQAGTARTLKMRICIQGMFLDQPGDEGLEIQHRASDADSWQQAGFVYGWGYSDSYIVGSTLNHDGGGTYTCTAAGGWIDVDIPIPDSATQIRLHPQYEDIGLNQFAHDIALRSFQWEYTEPSSSHDVDADDASWSFAVATPSVKHDEMLEAMAGDAHWAFSAPEPTTSLTRMHDADAGDAGWSFAAAQPGISKYLAADAGDAGWSFAAPDPTVQIDKALAADAGDANWHFSAAYSAPDIDEVRSEAGDGYVLVRFARPTNLAAAQVRDYQYRLSTDGGTTWASWMSAGVNIPSVLITGLANGRAYSVQVRAVSVDMTEGTPSPPWTFTPRSQFASQGDLDRLGPSATLGGAVTDPGGSFAAAAAPIYSDIGGTPSVDDRIVDLDAVFTSLENIFVTRQDERLFNLDVTANLEPLLFRRVSEDTAAEIRRRALDSIRRWEPRIHIINSLSFVAVNEDENGYDVDFAFDVNGIDNTQRYQAYMPSLAAG